MPNGATDLFSGSGQDTNRVKIGGKTELLGDPAVKPEKPHTIIGFPGGDVEIARTTDGDYWVHIAVRKDHENPTGPSGRIIRARMDHHGRYNDEGNAALQAAIGAGDVYHIAFLIQPAAKPL